MKCISQIYKICFIYWENISALTSILSLRRGGYIPSPKGEGQDEGVLRTGLLFIFDL
jgi:hypothetical protein